jgi:hypothetical protein
MVSFWNIFTLQNFPRFVNILAIIPAIGGTEIDTFISDIDDSVVTSCEL